MVSEQIKEEEIEEKTVVSELGVDVRTVDFNKGVSTDKNETESNFAKKKEEVDPKINHIQITKKGKAKDISCL